MDYIYNYIYLFLLISTTDPKVHYYICSFLRNNHQHHLDLHMWRNTRFGMDERAWSLKDPRSLELVRRPGNGTDERHSFARRDTVRVLSRYSGRKGQEDRTRLVSDENLPKTVYWSVRKRRSILSTQLSWCVMGDLPTGQGFRSEAPSVSSSPSSYLHLRASHAKMIGRLITNITYILPDALVSARRCFGHRTV